MVRPVVNWDRAKELKVIFMASVDIASKKKKKEKEKL